ncbi:hypothetical protein PV682_25015 [Streptomyces niveiscabiei]|nr:hypothetical protein [Streptomyces niveiscabiei]MDX3384704.1 hypothetical protein [Streptomyces niveiscabiei]
MNTPPDIRGALCHLSALPGELHGKPVLLLLPVLIGDAGIGN